VDNVPVMDVLHPWQSKMHSQYISSQEPNVSGMSGICSPARILHATLSNMPVSQQGPTSGLQVNNHCPQDASPAKWENKFGLDSLLWEEFCVYPVVNH